MGKRTKMATHKLYWFVGQQQHQFLSWLMYRNWEKTSKVDGPTCPNPNARVPPPSHLALSPSVKEVFWPLIMKPNNSWMQHIWSKQAVKDNFLVLTSISFFFLSLLADSLKYYLRLGLKIQTRKEFWLFLRVLDLSLN